MKANYVFCPLILALYVLLPMMATHASPLLLDQDKTESPYFFVKSDDPSVDQLSLKATDVEVDITGVIAHATIKQTYQNKGTRPIEAIYVFPLSTNAAVHAMQMQIGERRIEAKIEEKQKARRDYEQAKQEGKRASLLEQERPNVFQMNVANIMPNDVIEVTLSYTELLVPENGVYEFVYPTVVGPRYQGEQEQLSASTNNDWVANPYLEEGKRSPSEFYMHTHLNAGLPIQKATCTSHQVNINYLGKNELDLDLTSIEQFGGNRDYIVQYELKGKQINSGVLLHEGEEENFFLAMIQPPERFKEQAIPPREYIFVVDVSGSMNGFPLDVSKKLLSDLIGNLRSSDQFNVLLFAGASALLSEKSLTANPQNVQKALQFIDRQEGSGGTELNTALYRALNLTPNPQMSRHIIIATDGYISADAQTFDLIRENLGNANMYAFGIGSSVNRHLIEGMAFVGQGEPFVVTNEYEALQKGDALREYIQSPLLTNIQLRFNGLNTYDVSPKSIPDVLSDRPIVVFGKYKGKAGGAVQITGHTGNGAYEEVLPILASNNTNSNEALRYLWARNEIKLAGDYAGVNSSPELKERITNLGLQYHLMTQYTSFIAIDEEVVNENGDVTSVKQALPLPKGVSNSAVGQTSKRKPMKKRAMSAPVKPISTSEILPELEEAPSPIFDLPPPPPPVLNVIADEEIIEESELMPVPEPKVLPVSTSEVESEPEIFGVVEEMPEFPGGNKALLAFIQKHIRFPKEAAEIGTDITIYVRFVVDKEGALKDIVVVRGHDNCPSCEEEALRLIRLLPKWKPGKQMGKLVAVTYTLPVRFALEGK